MVSLLLLKVIFLLFVFECGDSAKAGIKKVTHKINTTECTWKIRGQRHYYGKVTINHWGDFSYNHGPHMYGVCTFTYTDALHVNKSSTVDIVGRHSLAIKSKSDIRISTPFILDWSTARSRSDMWLGGFCSHGNHLNKTTGNGPGGGDCHGSAGHGGMGIGFEKDANEIKYGWRYGSDSSINVPLIGGSSGGVRIYGSGFSCGGGAIMISSDTSVTVESNISTNAYNFYGNDSSCVQGGSGGTIIIVAKKVSLARDANLESRGAPGSGDSTCSPSSGSGGVIVINGTINGTTPNPHKHTSPFPKVGGKKSNGVVFINGTNKDRLPLIAKVPSSKGYHGCYSRSKEFNYSVLPDHKVTPINCKGWCKDCGYKYAVLHVKLCACVNYLDEMSYVSVTKCSLRCFQTEYARCGGQDGNNMYYVVYESQTNQTNRSKSNFSTPETCPIKPAKYYCNYLNMSTLVPPTKPVSTNYPVYTTLVAPTARVSSTETNKLQDLSNIPVNKNTSETILKELSNITTNNDLGLNDLILTFAIFEAIVLGNVISTYNKTESERIGQLVLNIADNLLNASDSSWIAFEKEKKKNPELLLTFVEKAASMLGETLDTNDSLTLNSSNFGLRIERVNPDHFHNHTFIISGLNIIEKKTNIDSVESDEEFVFLPSSLPEAVNGSGSFNLHLLKYRPRSILVNASLKNSSVRSVLASNIIAISVSRPLKKELKENVVLSFPLSKTFAKDGKRSCRFLDFEERSDVSWSTRGCISQNGKERTECLCNHFTSFAVLTEVQQVYLEKAHIEALHWLTYIGCTVSLFCFIVTLTTFAVLKTWVSDHIWIHCNLIASLTMAQLVFIFGIKATEYKAVCKGIAIALQYLYTSAIFWMCIEGIHLYRKVVKVFIKSCVKKYYYIFGWGGPALMVLISALLRFDGFGSEKACWLSIGKGLIWAFVAPVLGIVLINLIILLLVIRIMLVAVNTIPPKGAQNSSIRNGIKGVIFLLPILGVTWVFGVVAVNHDTIAFQYIFTVLNSFQGLFIFLFHCVFNKDVRAAVQKLRKKKAASSQRWSYDSTWKSSKDQKSSQRTNRASNQVVNKIHVQELP